MSSSSRRLAVVIGVSKYDDAEGAGELPFAVNDANRLRSILISCGTFAPADVYLLSDIPPADDANKADLPTRANILQQLTFVAKMAEPNDLVLVYFAGHGVEIEGTPYLLTSDTKLDVLAETAIDVRSVNEILQNSKAKCVIRVFDACRSGYAAGRLLSERMSDQFQKALFVDATGWATLSACSSGEIAREDSQYQQGVFSYYFCEGLEGKAANDEGQVTLDLLVDYIKVSMRNWCAQQTIQQTPHVQYDIAGSLVFSSTRLPSKQNAPQAHTALSKLTAALDSHLDDTASDARQLVFTDKRDFVSAVQTVFTRLTRAIEGFQHSAITIECTDAFNFEHSRPREHKRMLREMAQAGVINEFTKDQSAVSLGFVSGEAVIASTWVAVVVTRFSFFYWIYFQHDCNKSTLQTQFSPDPPSRVGFITLKPSAILDAQKVDVALEQLLARLSEGIIDWSDQLKEFVESTIAPLRTQGKIIE